MPAFKKLAELRPAKLSLFWTDWAPLLKSGEVTMAVELDYYVEAMKTQGYPVDYIYPKEKAVGLSEYASIVKGTKNPELAEAFLNTMLDPKIQEALSVETYQGSVSGKVTLSARRRRPLRLRAAAVAAAVLRPGVHRPRPPGLDGADDHRGAAGMGDPLSASAAALAAPKAELHVHLEGTLEPEMLFALARRNGVEIPWDSEAALRASYRYEGLASFSELYQAGLRVLRTERDYFELTAAYLVRARADNIVHAEVFVSPQAHIHRGVRSRRCCPASPPPSRRRPTSPAA